MHSFATLFGAKWKYFAIFRILLLLRKWESQRKIQRKRQRVRQTGQKKKLLNQNEIKGVWLCVSEAVYVYASALYYNSIGEIFFFVFISFTLTSHFFRFGEEVEYWQLFTAVYSYVKYTHTSSHTYACNWSGELHKICKRVWSMCMWRLRLLLNKRTTHQHVYRACQTKIFSMLNTCQNAFFDWGGTHTNSYQENKS